jgi:hypothetical protein
MTQLTVHECEVCARAVDYFGRRAQLRKVAEELRELADECDAAANGGSSMDALALERADVEVMLYQFDALLLPTMAVHVSAKIASQIARLERRMDGENTARSVRG